MLTVRYLTNSITFIYESVLAQNHFMKYCKKCSFFNVPIKIYGW